MGIFKKRTEFINEKYKTAKPEDKKLLGNGFIPEHLQPEYETYMAKSVENLPVSEDGQIELISNANWFAIHPNKVAGKMTAGTGFLNPIIVKGTITDVVETIDHTLDKTAATEPVEVPKDATLKMKKEFTFLSKSPMQQGKAIKTLEKRVNNNGKIMPYYEMIESWQPGLKVETSKIHSRKAESGYVEKLTVGDNIVNYKYEADYYEYLQSGGMPYSEHLKEEQAKAEVIRVENEKKKNEADAEFEKKQDEINARATASKHSQIKELIENGPDFVIEKITDTFRRNIDAGKEVDRNKMYLEQAERQTRKNHKIAVELYEIISGKPKQKFTWKEGDSVTVYGHSKDTLDKKIETKIEKISINKFNEPTYKVEEKEGMYNTFFGYDSVFPIEEAETPFKKGETILTKDKNGEFTIESTIEKIGAQDGITVYTTKDTASEPGATYVASELKKLPEMKKISEKYWNTLKDFEKKYIQERQDKDTISNLKQIINEARKQHPDYVKIYKQGFIETPDGAKYLFSGHDTKKFKLVEEKENIYGADQHGTFTDNKGKIRQDIANLIALRDTPADIKTDTPNFTTNNASLEPKIEEKTSALQVIAKNKLADGPDAKNIGKGDRVQNVNETINKYNPGLSDNEIKAWVYYKRRYGNPMKGWENYFLSGGTGFTVVLETTHETVIKDNTWQDIRTIPAKVNLGVKTKFAHEYQGINYIICKTQEGELVWVNKDHVKEQKISTGETQNEIDELVADKALIFDGTDYYPVPVFLFGNVYEKIKLLDFNRDAIIEKYGEAQYDQQLAKVREYIPKIKSFRDPVKTNRPHMLCLSEMALNPDLFGILTLHEEIGIKLGYTKRGYFRTLDEKISLFDAFVTWMDQSVKDIDLKGTTRADIKKYYFAKSISWPKNYDGTEVYTKSQKDEFVGAARLAAENLFSEFLATALTFEDSVALDVIWNEKYNAFTNIIQFVDKIPIGFNGSTWFKDGALDIKPAQRQGLAYMQLAGSGCLAYDVCFGKTLTGILNLAQLVAQGAVKRPLIVVPKPTYKNWIKELFGYWTDGESVKFSEFPGSVYHYGAFSGVAGVKFNDWYNLSGSHFKALMDANGGDLNKLIPEGTITVVSYTGFTQMGFSREMSTELFDSIARVIMQKDAMDDRQAKPKSEKQEAKEQVSFYQKVQGWLGLGNKGAIVNVDQCGFDHITVDEAHNFKNAFPSCGKDPKTGRKLFNISAGQSSRAVKMFFITNYIQAKFGKKVCLLTATPFTNSPLEIYSMLSYVGLDSLNAYNLFNIKKFFEQFVLETIEYAIDAKGEIITKPVIKSFQNLKLLQTILFNHFHHKDDPKEAGVVRPCILPLPNKDFSMYLEMNEHQRANQLTVKEMAKSVSRSDPGAGLRAMGMSLDNAFSPFLIGKQTPASAEEFVNNSPKIKFAVECTRSIKTWHESRGESCSGIIFYSNRGKDYFDYIKDYLITNVGFNDKVSYDEEMLSEVEIITGGGGEADEDRKELIKDAFNAGVVKIIIGTATIREGINLQKRCPTTFNLYPEWNPTDVTQLKGRNWRQGNIFGYVRFVTPLVINSMDNFINQKLDEKGKRIANIWGPIGDLNVMENSSDLDPSEIKYALVDDANEKFKMKFEGQKMEMQRAFEVLHDNKTTLDDVSGSIESLKTAEENVFEDILEKKTPWANLLKYLKTVPVSKIKTDSPKTVKDIERVSINIGELLDAFGKYEANRYDIDMLVALVKMLQNRDYSIFTDYSDVGRQIDRTVRDLTDYQTFKVYEHYRKSLIEAWGEVKRAERSVLSAYGKTWLDDFNEVITEVNRRIEDTKEQAAGLQSEEYKQRLITEIQTEMDAAKAVRGDLQEQVNKFSGLNYLLSYLSDNTDKEDCPIPTVECCTTNGIQMVHQDKYHPEPVMFEEVERVPVADPVEATELAEIQEAIELLTEMLSELKGKDKKEAKEAIELLKEML